MTQKEINHLEWIFERLVHVHGENPNYDYMVRFRQIIESPDKLNPLDVEI